MEPQDVVIFIIAIESISCIVPTETVTCRIDFKIFHLRKWCESEIYFKNLTLFSHKKAETNNKAVYLRLLFIYLYQNVFYIKRHLVLVGTSQKSFSMYFSVYSQKQPPEVFCKKRCF